jgi:hypothetical protein
VNLRGQVPAVPGLSFLSDPVAGHLGANYTLYDENAGAIRRTNFAMKVNEASDQAGAAALPVSFSEA